MLETTDPLVEAHEKARHDKWVEAVALCEQVRNRETIATDPRRAATFLEFLGICQFRGAFHSQTRPDFERLMTEAGDSFEKASMLFRELREPAEADRSEARAVFSWFWLDTDSKRRADLAKTSLDLSIRASKAALNDNKRANVLLDFLEYFRESCNLATDFGSLKHSFDKSLEIGRNILAGSEEHIDTRSLIKTFNIMIWLLGVEAQVILSPSDFQSLVGEIRSYEEKIDAAASELEEPYSKCLASQSSADVLFDVVGDPQQALDKYQSSLNEAFRVGDVLLVGRLQWSLSQLYFWLGSSQSDGTHSRTSLEKGLELASAAILNLEIPLATTELVASYALVSKCQTELSKLDTEVEKRKDRLRRAVEAGSKGSLFESETWAWNEATHARARALYFLSRLEEPKEQLELLRESLKARKDTVRVSDRLFPTFWNAIVMYHDLALLQSELAPLEPETGAGRELLTQAISSIETCLERGKGWATNPGFTYRLAQYEETYGNILLQEYASSRGPAIPEIAVRAYKEAISLFKLSRNVSAIPPIKWKIARAYDEAGRYEDASGEYKDAAEAYRNAAKQLPGSKSTFQELARYLSSWAIIEDARLHHSREEYSHAAKLYGEAARILDETEAWNYLSIFCIARSSLEKGEGLSQQEKYSASTESFAVAAHTFSQGKDAVEARLKRNVSPKEVEELQYWNRLARDREEYSLGRVRLDEARRHDKAGDKTDSSREYLSASELFTALAAKARENREHAELETLGEFCQGLALMKNAEVKVSPELYSKAAELFMQVKESSPGDKFRLLALANASICRSLEAGIRFRLTRDLQLYSTIKGNLESAADYYHEAGFKKAAGWTRGYQRLFDSLFCLATAESEMDRKKKAEQYDLAEKNLESAARLFGEAGFPARRLEALERLKHARETKDILLSSIFGLGEMPTSSSAILTPLTLAGSHALGVERFEDANVVGTMSLSKREVSPGSEVCIDLDFTNVGRTAATLIKLDNVVPEGCDLDSGKTLYRKVNGSLDLEGRRLDYLKTFKAKIFLKATRPGAFEVRPSVTFSDEKGHHQLYNNWRETILVQEQQPVGAGTKRLEIAPTKIAFPAEFRFETERARRVFEYLVREFLIDYMTKRLYVERAGWRSLMDVARELKLPRSVVYSPRRSRGPTLAELEKRGLVETRTFPGERGRGGEITKVRVAYENGIVKRLLDRLVMTDES